MWLFLKFTWYVSFSYFDNYLLDLKNTSDLGESKKLPAILCANSTCGGLFTYMLSNFGVYCFIYGNLVAYMAI